MARIRSIHPGFKGDAKVRRLSRDARLTFLLMLPEADDEGRLLGSPRSLTGALFPNDDDVTAKMVMRWVGELVNQGMVAPYVVDGIDYLHIPKFKVYQRPKNPSPSKLPPPPDTGVGAGVETSPLPTPDTSGASAPLELGGRRLELGGGTEPPPAPPPGRAVRLPDDFEVTDEMRAWAWREAPTVNMAAETAKFRDYWVAQGGQRGRKLDWVATWRNWIRKAAEDRPSSNGVKPPAVQYTSAFKVNPNR